MNLKINICLISIIAISAIALLQFCKGKPEKEYEAYLERGFQKNFEMKTISDLQEIRVAIGNYMMKENKMPVANNIFELMRILRPQYLSQPVFYDAWNQELIVKSSSTHIEIISKGIDGALGTRDDIIMRM